MIEFVLGFLAGWWLGYLKWIRKNMEWYILAIIWPVIVLLSIIGAMGFTFLLISGILVTSIISYILLTIRLFFDKMDTSVNSILAKRAKHWKNYYTTDK